MTFAESFALEVVYIHNTTNNEKSRLSRAPPRASPLPDFHVYLLQHKPTGKEAPHTLGASAAINPKRVE